jgi:hypothetical protein
MTLLALMENLPMSERDIVMKSLRRMGTDASLYLVLPLSKEMNSHGRLAQFSYHIPPITIYQGPRTLESSAGDPKLESIIPRLWTVDITRSGDLH